MKKGSNPNHSQLICKNSPCNYRFKRRYGYLCTCFWKPKINEVYIEQDDLKCSRKLYYVDDVKSIFGELNKHTHFVLPNKNYFCTEFKFSTDRTNTL